MPVLTDFPNGLGSSDDWYLEGAPSKIAAVAGPADGDATIIFATSGGEQRYQLFTFPPLVGVADPLTSSILYAGVREYAQGVGGRTFHFLWNGPNWVGPNKGAEIHAQTPGSYIMVNHTIVAPTVAEVNGQHGMYMAAAGGPEQKWELWCTLFYRETSFSYSASTANDDYATLLGCLVGALGAGLLLRDMPGIARTIARRTGLLILPAEYADALRAWRSQRHVAVA